ncbi:MAG: DciA family protein [Opitutus sp.]
MSDAPHQFSKLAEELVGDLRGMAFEEPRRTVKRPTQGLSAVIDQLMTKHQIGRPSAEQTVRDHWSEIVGSANAAHSHAVTIERNRLVVSVSHSVVRNELFHHREQIVARLRGLPGCDTIKSLNLRAG